MKILAISSAAIVLAITSNSAIANEKMKLSQCWLDGTSKSNALIFDSNVLFKGHFSTTANPKDVTVKQYFAAVRNGRTVVVRAYIIGGVKTLYCLQELTK